MIESEWEKLESLITAITGDTTYGVYEHREIVNAIFYELRSGCPWRLISHDLPNQATVYDYFQPWRQDETWDKVLGTLRREARQREDQVQRSSTQSIKTSAVREPEKGYNTGKVRSVSPKLAYPSEGRRARYEP